MRMPIVYAAACPAKTPKGRARKPRRPSSREILHLLGVTLMVQDTTPRAAALVGPKKVYGAAAATSHRTTSFPAMSKPVGKALNPSV